MKREEILNRVKKDNPNTEYEKQMIFKGLWIGLIGMAFLYIVLMYVNIFVLNKQDVNDLTCLVSGFVAISAVFSFLKSKKIQFLFISIATVIMSITSFVSFCLGR